MSLNSSCFCYSLFFYQLFRHSISFFFFFFNDTATTEIYTLSLHDALPISWLSSKTVRSPGRSSRTSSRTPTLTGRRSEEHTSELQSPCNLVCRLLLEKKKKKKKQKLHTKKRHSTCVRREIYH